MKLDLRLPNITERTTSGQIFQILRYIRQAVERLNWAFDQIPEPKQDQQTQTLEKKEKKVFSNSAWNEGELLKTAVQKAVIGRARTARLLYAVVRDGTAEYPVLCVRHGELICGSLTTDAGNQIAVQIRYDAQEKTFYLASCRYIAGEKLAMTAMYTL